MYTSRRVVCLHFLSAKRHTFAKAVPPVILPVFTRGAFPQDMPFTSMRTPLQVDERIGTAADRAGAVCHGSYGRSRCARSDISLVCGKSCLYG